MVLHLTWVCGGQPTEKLGFGLALTNLGRMQWQGVYREVYQGEFILDHPLSLVDDFDELEELEEEDFLEYDYEQIEKSEGGTLSVSTPISLTGNVQYKLHPRLYLAGLIGYNQAPVPNANLAVGTRIYFPAFFTLNN